MKKKFKEEKAKKEKQNDIKQIKEIIPFLKNGLENSRCLYKDGILNLHEDKIEYLTSEKGQHIVVFLVAFIQAFPGTEAIFENTPENDEFFEKTKMLETLLHLGLLEKKCLMNVEYNCNKLELDKEFKIKMTEKGIELGDELKIYGIQMGLDPNDEDFFLKTGSTLQEHMQHQKKNKNDHK